MNKNRLSFSWIIKTSSNISKLTIIYIATLHHSQQRSVEPLFEASTCYHNIFNAKKGALHPYKGQLNPFNPMECRIEHSFPMHYLVLTEMVANKVIVLNTLDDKVYRVDFEGGDEKLLNGVLQAEWQSFEEFLIAYFEL